MIPFGQMIKSQESDIISLRFFVDSETHPTKTPLKNPETFSTGDEAAKSGCGKGMNGRKWEVLAMISYIR